MTTPTPRGGRDLSKIALQVATEASRLVLAGFRQNPSVSYKAHEEPYTEFDVQSEELIRKRSSVTQSAEVYRTKLDPQ